MSGALALLDGDVEHRLIPARVWSEWARLRGKGLASTWAPACQDTSHVGNAGVGVVSLRGAPVALPTFAGDFNVEPTKILCLEKWISAGLWFDLEASWSLAGACLGF